MSSPAQRRQEHRRSIERKAGEFAARVNHTLKAFLGRDDDVVHVDARGSRVVVKTIQGEGLVLTVSGNPVFRLTVRYHCELNQANTYLAVESSAFAIHHHLTTEPIVRYDFIRSPKSSVPSAHINMHTVSEALTRAMEDAGKNRRADRRRLDTAAGTSMRPSQLHLPLGGPRFRPALEDVLEMLVVEFAIDRSVEWRSSLREGRSLWRDTQLRAAVADNPEAAVEALTELGYTVEWLGSTEEKPGLRSQKLEQF
ncbi:hypothetical protein PV768_20635 [Pseudarthrobacter sp. CC4]|uniref:hypothetical protein n=1 Tax=Pseudarthrobacter sp. CC4 TaxID=3029190 RepID=UPI003B8BABE1